MTSSLLSKNKLRFVYLTPSLFYEYDIPAIFQNCLQKYYGDQSKALKKIISCKDRTCEVLLNNGVPCGLLVYKNDLQKQLLDMNYFNYLEIKTLLVIEPEKYHKKRLGSRLLLRACNFALEKHASHIFVTVSSGCTNSLAFFLHYGFKCVKVCKNRHKQDLNEHFLIHSDSKSLIKKLTETILTKTNKKLLLTNMVRT